MKNASFLEESICIVFRPNYKFFFKSMDDDFGVVKEEVIEDKCPLPTINGRVVSWLVSADIGSTMLSCSTNSNSNTGVGEPPPGRAGGLA